jgi:hypothetical protein
MKPWHWKVDPPDNPSTVTCGEYSAMYDGTSWGIFRNGEQIGSSLTLERGKEIAKRHWQKMNPSR